MTNSSVACKRRRISGRRLSDDRKYVCVRRLTHQELALATCNYWALSNHQEYTKQERNFFNLICKHWQLTYETRGIVFHRILNTEATSTRIRIFLKTEIVFLRFNLTFKRKWIILGETQSKCSQTFIITYLVYLSAFGYRMKQSSCLIYHFLVFAYQWNTPSSVRYITSQRLDTSVILLLVPVISLPGV